MNEVDDQSWRVHANLAIFEASYRFGDTGALRNWMHRKKSVFESNEAKLAYRDWETRLAEMEDFERIHGIGSCLQVNDPALQAFVSRHRHIYPSEYLERAKVANFAITASFLAETRTA